MQKIPVVYWSGTGNTKMMAEAVAEGIKEAGAEALLRQVGEITAAEAAEYPVLALGCPAMGAENLEEMEFEPFFAELEGSLLWKKLLLFGSYGWGGSYMREWEARAESAGAALAAAGVLALNEPDETALETCREAGRILAEAV